MSAASSGLGAWLRTHSPGHLRSLAKDGPARWLPPRDGAGARERTAAAPTPRAPAAVAAGVPPSAATGAADKPGRALRCPARQSTATAGRSAARAQAGQAQPVRRLFGGRRAQRRRGGREPTPGGQAQRAAPARREGVSDRSPQEARPCGARCAARERGPAIGRETLNCLRLSCCAARALSTGPTHASGAASSQIAKQACPTKHVRSR